MAAEYGSSALDIARSIAEEPTLGERLVSDRAEVLAMVDWAVKTEFAMRLSDVMIRRTQLFFKDQDQGLGALDRIADRMGMLLDWTPETIQEEKEAYREEVALSRQWQAE